MEDIDLTSTKFAQTKAPCPLSTVYLLSTYPAPVHSQGHRAFIARKLHKEGHFTPTINGGPDGKHRHLVHSWQVTFKCKPTPALPRCPSNKINTTLQSKELPSSWNLMHRFHLWFSWYAPLLTLGNPHAWAKYYLNIVDSIPPTAILSVVSTWYITSWCKAGLWTGLMDWNLDWKGA